jgi:hypothetical protein
MIPNREVSTLVRNVRICFPKSRKGSCLPARTPASMVEEYTLLARGCHKTSLNLYVFPLMRLSKLPYTWLCLFCSCIRILVLTDTTERFSTDCERIDPHCEWVGPDCAWSGPDGAWSGPDCELIGPVCIYETFPWWVSSRNTSRRNQIDTATLFCC